MNIGGIVILTVIGAVGGLVTGVLLSSAVRSELTHLKTLVVAKFETIHAKLDAILEAVKAKV